VPYLDPNILNDVIPEKRWRYDLLDPVAGEEVKAIAADIKAVAQASLHSRMMMW
jgi:hypothetical protein